MPTRLLRTLVGIASIIVILALVGSASGCGSSTPSEAQDFTLPDLAGANITLSELEGTPVVLSFWSISCSWCRYQLPFLENVARQSEGDMAVMAVNVGDSNSTVLSFFNDYEPTMTVVLDRDGAIFVNYCESYGNSRTYTPFTLFVDSEGLVQYTRIGAFSSEEELWNTLHDVLGITIP